MRYRSDWPEVGWPAPLAPPGGLHPAGPPGRDADWREVSGFWLRTAVSQNHFESDLYGLPIWNLHLEALESADAALRAGEATPELQDSVRQVVEGLLTAAPWHRSTPTAKAYVCSKVVPGEPLHTALVVHGFEEVEYRRLYLGRISDIAARQTVSTPGAVRIHSLADLAPELRASCQSQILDLCREAFTVGGHTRHFTDPILLERQPGIAYILAVMELNFRRLPTEQFLLALEPASDQVCGFTVIGEKPGLEGAVYTQLLSAVRRAYRGRGVYRSLTSQLSRVLPQEAVLLNVTHVDNLAIQRAYQDSGREHVADTVVLRRLFEPDANS